MRILKIICRIFFFLPAMLISCSHFLKTEYVCFYLPEKTTGRLIYSRQCVQQQTDFKEQNKIFLDMEKNEATAILVFTEENVHPYGAIYPYEENLSKESAFAAEILHTLTVNSTASDKKTKDYLSKFNWKRFLKETKAFGDDVWKLNKELIMQKIASGTFKKTDLKLQ